MAESIPQQKQQSVFESFSSWRNSLPKPGTFDQLHREVRSVFVTHFLFDGAKFNFAKVITPNFQATHSFSLGSQQQPPSYQFGATFADQKYFLNGQVDHEGNLHGQVNYGLTSTVTGKVETQIGSQVGTSMLQLELDHQAKDHSLNFKAVNPSPVDGTGIYVGSYLQSLTKRIAVGAEVALQRPNPEINQAQTSFVMKYAEKDYVFTANLSQIGLLQASYFHRLNERIELGAELQLVSMQEKREALVTLGTKWEFLTASFRGQLDTTGRVSAVLEERVGPGMALLLSGDIDHFKGQSKFGIGLQMEI